MLSQCAYSPADKVVSDINPFILFLVNAQTKNLETFIYSLLNVYLAYDPNGYDLPYLSKVNDGEPEMLVKLCLHILIILYDYLPPNESTLHHLINDL